MKIAIVGGGIFGVTIAFKLAERHSVDLFEKNDDILKGASDVNQCRVHRGYHYPRSKETVSSVLEAENSFMEEFSDAILKGTEVYYCIAKKDSLTSRQQYIDFCKQNNLEFVESNLDVIDKEQIDLCVKVKENLFDHEILKKICWKKLKQNNVRVLLKKEATETIFDHYDFVVICTYAHLNKLLKRFPQSQRDYQYEICEKLFVELPTSFNNKSILIMDGPFMSIDPVGTTGLFIIGDVVNTVCKTNTGKHPKINGKFLPLLDKGIIKNPPITNFRFFIESAARFIPQVRRAKHIGSAFCIKTVLPKVDNTDERPTLIEVINNKTVTVFSGKIPTCVETAKKVAQKVEEFTTKKI